MAWVSLEAGRRPPGAAGGGDPRGARRTERPRRRVRLRRSLVDALARAARPGRAGARRRARPARARLPGATGRARRAPAGAPAARSGEPLGPGTSPAPPAPARLADRDPRARSRVHARRRPTSCCSRTGWSSAPELVETLCRRTEGWAAGLRLAALSLQRQPDPEHFVAEFAGDDRVVADYLLAEVLQRRAAAAAAVPAPDVDRRPPVRRPRGRDHRRAGRSQRRSRRSSATTASSSRSIRSGAGTGCTGCSASCCACMPGASSATSWASCTAARRSGTSRPASRRMRCATPRLGADWDLTADLVATHWLELSARSRREVRCARSWLRCPPERRDADPRHRGRAGLPRARGGRGRGRGRHLAQARRPDVPTRRARITTRSRSHGCERRTPTAASSGRRSSPARSSTTPAAMTAGRARCATRSPTASSASAGCGRPARQPAIDELERGRRARPRSRLRRASRCRRSATWRSAQALRAGPAAARELVQDALEEAAAGGRSATVDAAPGYLAAAVVALYERRLDDAGASLASARDALVGRRERLPRRRRWSSWPPSSTRRAATRTSALRRLDAPGAARRRLARVPALAAALRARVLVEQLGDRDGARAALSGADRSAGAAEIDVATARLHLAAGDPGARAAGARAGALRRRRCSASRRSRPRCSRPSLHEQLRDPAAADTALEAALALADESGHRGVFLAAGRLVEPLLRRRIRQRTAHPRARLRTAHTRPSTARSRPPRRRCWSRSASARR